MASSKYQETRKVQAVSKVYQRGKTHIPSDVRKSLGVKDGDKLLWIVDQGRWIVEVA